MENHRRFDEDDLRTDAGPQTDAFLEKSIQVPKAFAPHQYLPTRNFQKLRVEKYNPTWLSHARSLRGKAPNAFTGAGILRWFRDDTG